MDWNLQNPGAKFNFLLYTLITSGIVMKRWKEGPGQELYVKRVTATYEGSQESV